jgi:Ca-activated chloride channel family protein
MCLAAVCFEPTALSAQRPPAFKSASATVPLFVTVTDSARHLVRGLTADDFVVLDNRHPQPLTVFAEGTAPLSIVVLLDNSHSMADKIAAIRDGALRFFEHLRESDRVEIGSFNGAIQFARPFTNNERSFQLALLTMPPVGYGTALWDALDEGISELTNPTGRRVVLIFTDGEGNMGHMAPRHVIAHAQAEDVMIYVIRLETTRTFQGKTGLSVPDPQLAVIADDTGGGYFNLSNTDDVATAFVHVSEELHSQFILGFESKALDGSVHTVNVRLSRPDLLARARRSYMATPLHGR